MDNPAKDPNTPNLSAFLALFAQLGLLALVVHRFEIESDAFRQILLLAVGGFAVHYFLPFRHRLRFFLLLSLVGIATVVGLKAGAWIIAIGLGLVGIAHLPIPFRGRIAILVLAGCGAAMLRSSVDLSPLPFVVWPILASMFMFRMIVYVHDLRHGNGSFELSRALSYFFLLPNVCFPLFPVVDYKTYCRTYYDGDRHQIHQLGIHWMLRGVIQLLLYRFVYYYVTISASEVVNAADLARYMVSGFLMYLRISGQFHIIVGMLHLFGFNLPETHLRYLLSSSFTDFWRRINVYWKDFIMKIFFYPAYFRLRRLGDMGALVVATLFAFVVTWVLHSYQWFWIRGSFPVLAQDLIFWGFLGLAVTANAIYETKRGRQGGLGRRTLSLRGRAILAMRTIAFFIFICVLWSLWTSNSVSEWVALWPAALVLPEAPVVRNIALFLLLAAITTVALVANWDRLTRWRQSFGRETFAAMSIATMLVLLPFSIGSVSSLFGTNAADVIATLGSSRKLSEVDLRLMERGYYEELLAVHLFNRELWEVYENRPSGWGLPLQRTAAARLTGDLLEYELRPSSSTVFKDATISTNSWGMRDREYRKQKSPETCRIALLGGSHVMGSGVEDDEVFEGLLEDRLNVESSDAPYGSVEILNFASSGYNTFRNLKVLEDKVLAFKPNAVFYVVHPREEDRLVRDVVAAARRGVDLEYEYLKEVAKKAGLQEGMLTSVGVRRLTPYAPEMLSWVYRRVVEVSRENGIVPVWVFLPLLEEGSIGEDHSRDCEIAANEEFLILDLSGVYDQHDLKTLWIAEWDNHPNALGHQLVSQRLYELLQQEDGWRSSCSR